MQFSALAALLAAGSAVAAPSTVAKRSSALQITDFWANASRASQTSNLHFVLTDPNYPDDTPVDCNVIWNFNGSPDENARCLGSQYYIRFPNGGKDISQLTVELERVEGPIPVKGQAVLNDETEGSKWKCGPTDNPGVTERCTYDGMLEIPV
ncbi:uncharacterized protein LDX57_002793 [Aspergillus melleus]|uniref:uncharacterized protein n=1 Tax=Aspergillus melleus TaxID=138277 RepID=UPI001E8ED6DD|nr:uncharacterized protein LDX57_002793 [Aspergillus melleus]KAH8425044.1 hypothetical protein LDX57_002793 [Aspergillus melleus]